MAHKLLLADDSVTIQRVIELTFADEDVDVITVGDGQLAIERLESDPPDIVLADVDMPKRDGYEVAAYVKSRPRLAHIPVVLLTGAFEPIDQVRAAAAGSSDVLAKPFEPQMVINRVKELLGKKRQNEEDQYEQLPTRQPVGATSTAPPIAQVASTPGNGQSSGDTGAALSLDDYFDQLDAAFSNLQPGAQTVEAVHEEIDWAAAMAPAVVAPDAPAFAPVEASVTAAKPVAPEPVISAFAADAATIDKPAEPVAALFAPSDTTGASASPPAAPIAAITPIVPIAPEPLAFTSAPSATAERAVALDAPAFAPVEASAPAGKPVAPIAPEPVAPIALVAAAPEPVVQPPLEPAPKPVTQRITTNPFATLSAAKAEAAARPAAPVITDEVIEEVVSRVLQRLTDRVVRETVTDIVSQTAERLVQEEIERIKNSTTE
jgi:CheY-like chemotaxis protein